MQTDVTLFGVMRCLFSTAIIKVLQLAGLVKGFNVTNCAGTASTQRKLLCVLRTRRTDVHLGSYMRELTDITT
jgi:hypothetical protein